MGFSTEQRLSGQLVGTTYWVSTTKYFIILHIIIFNFKNKCVIDSREREKNATYDVAFPVTIFFCVKMITAYQMLGGYLYNTIQIFNKSGVKYDFRNDKFKRSNIKTVSLCQLGKIKKMGDKINSPETR